LTLFHPDLILNYQMYKHMHTLSLNSHDNVIQTRRTIINSTDLNNLNNNKGFLIVDNLHILWLVHNIVNWLREKKHRHILCFVHFSSKAITFWSTFPENIRIRDAYHAKRNITKVVYVYVLVWVQKGCPILHQTKLLW
jgi:hypothetical protein